MSAASGPSAPVTNLPVSEWIAERFHQTYEELAPTFDYKTRPDSAVTWEDVPVQNKRLMVAVVYHLMARGVIDVGDGWFDATANAGSPAEQATS